MAALREIFADFGITFDRRRALERGNQRVNRMTDGLRRLSPIVSGVRGQLVAFAAAIGGAVMVRAMQTFIAGIVKIGDDLDKVSQQVGMSTQQLQAWRHAAELSGVDAAAFGNALGQLQRNSREAERGTSTMVEAFRDLGITVTDATGELKDPNTLLLEMADGLAAIDNETERTALAMTVLGRSGRRMLPLFAQGSDGARAMLAELEELGGGMSELSISESVKLNDELTRLRLVFTSLKSSLAQDLLPQVRAFVTWFIEARDVVQSLVRNTTMMRAVMIAAILAIVAVIAGTAPTWFLFAIFVGAVVAATALLALAIDDAIVSLQGGDGMFRSWGEGAASWIQSTNAGRDAITFLTYAVARLQQVFAALPATAAAAWQGVRDVATSAINTIIARVQALIAVVQNAMGVISSLGGAGSLARLGGALTRLTGGGGPERTPEQRAASLAAAPGAQLRSMAPGAGRQNVTNNVRAPSTVSVQVTEAQNPQATAAAVRSQIDASWQQQLRGLQAASVPQGEGS